MHDLLRLPYVKLKPTTATGAAPPHRQRAAPIAGFGSDTLGRGDFFREGFLRTLMCGGGHRLRGFAAQTSITIDGIESGRAEVEGQRLELM